jgi:hypothetical protein
MKRLLRERPHRIVANQDRRHEEHVEHVSPHEQRDDSTGCALQEIQTGGPPTRRRLAGEADSRHRDNRPRATRDGLSTAARNAVDTSEAIDTPWRLRETNDMLEKIE